MSSTSNGVTVTFPALGGSQLNLPDLLDFNLKHNSAFPIFVYAETESSKVTEIKMLEYIRAAHRVGKSVRGDSRPGEVIAIIANIDPIVYSALITGIIKTGLVVSHLQCRSSIRCFIFLFQPFPISPRNSPTAILNLLRKTSARRVLMTLATLQEVVDGLKLEIQMFDPAYVLSIEEVPTLQEAYPLLGRETAQDPFEPISTTFSPKDSDKAMFLHSSGSTGLPKPILLTHQIIKDDASLSELLGFSIPFLTNTVQVYIRKIHQHFSNPVMSAIGSVQVIFILLLN